MKPIGSATTGLLKPGKGQPSSTGKPHGAHGSLATSVQLPANSNSNQPPAVADIPKFLTLLTEPLTSLNMVHSRDAEGKNFTERQHSLMVPMTEAKQKYSMLMAMRLSGSNADVSDILKRMFAVMPKAKSNADHFAETWLGVLSGQPLASIYYAFLKFVKDPGREFAPTPGQFLAVVEDHAKRITGKAKSLAEAINRGE